MKERWFFERLTTNNIEVVRETKNSACFVCLSLTDRRKSPFEKSRKRMGRNAKLRVCASCEWIFKDNPSCPKCGFGHYGAWYVYGDRCYKYAKTQQPWIDKKMARYFGEL